MYHTDIPLAAPDRPPSPWGRSSLLSLLIVAITSATVGYTISRLAAPRSDVGTVLQRPLATSRAHPTSPVVKRSTVPATQRAPGPREHNAFPWLRAATAAAVGLVSKAPPAEAVELANPWSVQVNDIAPTLFQASLVPYLAFLFFLGRPSTKLPAGAWRGFAFLLVFVFATIPAGIYAKTQYGDILANVDWLHGGAESLLTITNLWIVFGLRSAMPALPRKPDSPVPAFGNPFRKEFDDMLLYFFGFLAVVGCGQAVQHGLLGLEPANALSLPTWIVHSSSVLEYGTAMGLVWRLADVTGIEQWRGLTYAMLPSFAGALTACTFHFFYNSPELNALVALQATLTLVGNCTCAFAAWRVWEGGKEKEKIEAFKVSLSKQFEADYGPEDTMTRPLPKSSPPLPATVPLTDTTGQWVVKLGLTSVFAALAVKFGELTLQAPFHAEAGLPLALAMIAVPTALNGAYFYAKSK